MMGLGLVKGRFGIGFGSVRKKFWSGLESVWDGPGVCVGSVRGRLGKVWDRFGIHLKSKNQ